MCAVIRVAIEMYVGIGGVVSVGCWELVVLIFYVFGENFDLVLVFCCVVVLCECELEDAASNAFVSSSSKNEGGCVVDVVVVLKYLFFLVGGKILYFVVLGICDFLLVYFVV